MKLMKLRRRQARLSFHAKWWMTREQVVERIFKIHMRELLHKKQRELQDQYAEHQKLILEQRQALVKREAVKLPELIPTWGDEAVAAKEKAAIVEWATTHGGMTTYELSGVVSASAVAILRKAWLHDLQALDQ